MFDVVDGFLTESAVDNLRVPNIATVVYEAPEIEKTSELISILKDEMSILKDEMSTIKDEYKKKVLLTERLLNQKDLKKLKNSKEEYPVHNYPACEDGYVVDTPRSFHVISELKSYTKLLHNNLDNPNPTLKDLIKLNKFKKKFPMFHYQVCMMCENGDFSTDNARIKALYIYHQLEFVCAKRLSIEELGLFDDAFILIVQGYDLPKAKMTLKGRGEHGLVRYKRITKIAKMAFKLYNKYPNHQTLVRNKSELT